MWSLPLIYLVIRKLSMWFDSHRTVNSQPLEMMVSFLFQFCSYAFDIEFILKYFDSGGSPFNFHFFFYTLCMLISQIFTILHSLLTVKNAAKVIVHKTSMYPSLIHQNAHRVSTINLGEKRVIELFKKSIILCSCQSQFLDRY